MKMIILSILMVNYMLVALQSDIFVD
ncbi:hypothetical protein BLA29_014741 [Euroglyphus maynei]|uniref:Uncharacterized protein n=1 Tax=Euroglyphus maynei TaxID=6958 RepID=A0A1Y3BJ88_EURMA|nr:hypothetical protein BLA29_014741 [Euroglyphus maynei]